MADAAESRHGPRAVLSLLQIRQMNGDDGA